MEFLELVLILAALIAALVFLLVWIRKVSIYYRTRYHFSLWSGVFLILLALPCVVIPLLNAGSWIPVAIGGALLLFTAIRDLRLAGLGMGFLALLFQLVMSALFLAALAAALVGRLVSHLPGLRAARRGGLLGELACGALLMPAFIKP